MKIDIITLFPDMFGGILSESMLKIAKKKKKISVKVHNLRSWTHDNHRTADDKPYGGGAGMVIKVEPVYRALFDIIGKKNLNCIRNKKGIAKTTKVILLTPQGKTFNQKTAKRLSKLKHIVLICGHYEGIDERIRSLVTDEILIGDYVLTGGEIPAMALVDSLARLIPGVLGDKESLRNESFENNLLEYPQYTRPREFENMRVPEVLLNGNHKKIEKWRKKEAVKKTKRIRVDLLKNREE